MCEVLGVSRAGFYRWLSRPPSQRQRANERLIAFLESQSKQEHCIPGYRKLWRVAVNAGFDCGQNRVQRLLQRMGYRSIRQPKLAFRKPRPRVAARPNLLNRQFAVSQLNQVWVSDITQVRCHEGWLYVAIVMDLSARRIVGWACGAQNTSWLVLQALKGAWRVRQPRHGELLFHSDQGVQYCSELVMHWLTRRGVTLSMSRRGNCWDNACAESFFAQMKLEWFKPLGPLSRKETQQELAYYIEEYYDGTRLHQTLGGVPPAQYEKERAA